MRQVLVQSDKVEQKANTAKSDSDEITRRMREMQKYKGEKQR